MRATLVAAGLRPACVSQRSDAIPVLGHRHWRTRLTRVADPMRAAVNDRAAADPAWVPAPCDPTWAERDTVRGAA